LVLIDWGIFPGKLFSLVFEIFFTLKVSIKFWFWKISRENFSQGN